MPVSAAVLITVLTQPNIMNKRGFAAAKAKQFFQERWFHSPIFLPILHETKKALHPNLVSFIVKQKWKSTRINDKLEYQRRKSVESLSEPTVAK